MVAVARSFFGALLFMMSVVEAAGAEAESPLAAPEVFGLGVISTQDFEYNTSFSPSGDTVWFTKSNPTFTRLTIVFSRRVDGAWTTPEVAPFSGVWRDNDPFVTRDGKRIYFVSYRPVSGTEEKDNSDIWYVDRTADGGWGIPVRLPEPVNSDANEFYACVTNSGTLYFASERDGGPWRPDMYRSVLTDAGYTLAEPLAINTENDEIDPLVSPDESFLVFWSRSLPGFGSADLFISFRTVNGWTEPRNLGPEVNSPFFECAPGLSPDGRWLYFASGRHADNLPRPRPMAYGELLNELRSPLNGGLNIYRVDLTPLFERRAE